MADDIEKEDGLEEIKNKGNIREKQMNKQLKAVLFISGVIIVILVLVFLLMQGTNKFTYQGIGFERHYVGQIELYTAQVPLKDSLGQITGYMAIDFRNDPRELRGISVDTPGGIGFVKDKLTYVSYGDLKQCGNNTLAAANLGIFLSDAGIDKKGALDNESYANNTYIPYVNCQTHPDNTVILVKSGNETRIEQTAKNCYELISKDCEIIRATEKFELAVLDQYLG